MAYMNGRQQFELLLILLTSVLIFLTYSPSDPRYFWMYWCTLLVFLVFGYLLDMMFSADMAFVFDPNPDNWRRKVDPRK